MKRICSAALIILTALPIASSAAVGKKKTATIRESATIVPGTSVSAYVIGDTIITTVRDDEAAPPVLLSGVRPSLQISFPLEHPWILVKQVHWDKANHLLTIDF